MGVTLHKPTGKFDVMLNKHDEDSLTLDYMKQCGIDKVRGGSFTKTVLTDTEVEIITRMIQTKEDRCFKCDQAGHFAKNCTNKIAVQQLPTPCVKPIPTPAPYYNTIPWNLSSSSSSDEEYDSAVGAITPIHGFYLFDQLVE